MDQTTVHAFFDELTKIASSEPEEANKLLGLPLSNKPSGTRDYEKGHEYEDTKAMEAEQQAQEEQAMMAEQQAATAPAGGEKKPGGDKKKSEKKDSKGGEKVKVEVHVDGKKTDAKKSESKEKKSAYQNSCPFCGRILRGDMDCDCPRSE